MTRHRAKAPSQRQLRVGEEVRHVLSQQLAHGGLRDPVLRKASITVSEVRMSPDLKAATVFVAPFAGAGMAEVLPALERAGSFLRQQIGRELSLRFTPSLRFEADTSFDEAARIESLLRQPRVRRDLADPAAAPDTAAPDTAAPDTAAPDTGEDTGPDLDRDDG